MNRKKIKAIISLSTILGGLRAKELIERKDLATTVKQVNMGDIKVSSKDGVKKAVLSVAKQGENMFIRNSEVKEVLVSTEFAKQSYADFCMDYVTVTADNASWIDMKNRSLFINHATGDVLIETTKTKTNKAGEEKDALLNIRTGNLVIKANTKAVEYKFFISTSSLVKEKSAIFFRASIAKSTNEILNKNIPGIIANLPKDLSQSDAVKFAARPGLAWTKGVEVATFQNVIKVEGNFDNADFNGKDRNTGDGAILVRASIIMDMFNLKSVAEAVKMILQARFFGIYKFQVIVVPDVLFEGHVKEYMATRKTTVYGDESKAEFLMDNNAQKAVIDVSKGFTLTLMSMGKFTEGRLNKQIIESLLVAGAQTGRLQEVVDFLEEAGIDQIAGIAGKALEVEPTALKMFRNRNAKGEVLAPYSLDVVNSVKPSNPIASRVRLDDSIATMAKIANKLGIELYTNSGASQIYNGVVSTDITAFIGKSIIPNGYVVVGKVTKELTRLKRVFGENSEEYLSYKEEFGTATMFKMPKMYFNEFYQAQVLDVDALVELIDSSDLPEGMKAGYKFYFENMSDATVMFPADRAVFELLAGMDIDFDKVVVVFNSLVNELLEGRQENLFISSTPVGAKKVAKKQQSSFAKALAKKNSNVITDADAPKMFNTTVEGFFYDVFMLQLEGEGQIGVITFYNNKIIALLLEVLCGNNAPAMHFLKECVVSTNGEKRAYNIDRDVIDPIYVDMMIAEMKQIEWSASNVVAFLTDCSKVFRLYQETAIDAAKTGIYLTAKLTVRTIVADSLLTIGVEYVSETVDGEVKSAKIPTVKRAEYEEKEVKFFEKQVDGRFIEARESMTTINLSDVMGKIQDKLIETINVEVKEAYGTNKELFAYTSLETTQMKDELDFALSSKEGRDVVNKLYLVKSLYHDVVSSYIETINSLDTSSEAYEEKFEALKEANKKQVAGLSNTARKIVANYNGSEFEIGALALAVGCSTKKDFVINSENKSRFAYNVLPEYATAFVVGGAKIKMNATVIKNVNPDCDAEEIEFVDGVAIDGSVLIKERFTGVATVCGNEVTSELNMFDAVEVKQGLSTLIIPAAGNEFVIEEMTRDSIISVSNKEMFFNANENSEFVKMNKSILFDADMNTEAEYYINDSQTVELYLNVKSAGRVVTKKVKCFALSVEVA